jgi:hypothetical protein
VLASSLLSSCGRLASSSPAHAAAAVLKILPAARNGRAGAQRFDCADSAERASQHQDTEQSQTAN